jgi:hypothetical protein
MVIRVFRNSYLLGICIKILIDEIICSWVYLQKIGHGVEDKEQSISETRLTVDCSLLNYHE